MLEIQQLSVSTQTGLSLVDPITLTLEAGKNITILGETGSGKSLLIQAIMGALPDGLCASGQISLNFCQADGSHTQCKTTPHSDRLQALWGKTLVMLPQEPRRSLDPIMAINQQLWESYHFVAGISAKTAQQQSADYLAQLGLTQAQAHYPHQLSGGMAQRASFAIATAAGGRILLADEPTKGLDPASKQAVIALLKQAYQNGGGLLTITHDIEVAEALGGEILVMKKGKLLEQGTAETLLHAPNHPYTQALIQADPKHWQKIPQNPTSSPLLSVENLAVKRGARTLFKQLSFQLNKGEILGVVGQSGIGKSSLADVLCGLLKPAEGKVIWHDNRHKKHQVLKLYQDPPEAFAPNVSLNQLLFDVIRYHQLDAHQLPPLLEQLALDPSLLNRCAENVSGGELQRVAILRALLLNPVLLFADEVTSRLDPITQQEVMSLLIAQCRARQCALVIVSHDANLIEKSCDKVIDLAHFTAN